MSSPALIGPSGRPALQPTCSRPDATLAGAPRRLANLFGSHRTRKGNGMKVGIIGAGNIDGTLVRRLSALGHDVSVANSRGPDTLGELSAETGATPATVEDAVRDAELVIVTIPLKNIHSLPRAIFDTRAPGAPIIDTNNYYPQQRDGRIEEIENGMTEARWVQQHVGSPVIKVFNNIYASHLLELGSPAGSERRIALPVAGDDAAAKKVAMALVDELGFDPVDAGGLGESWRQQPGTPAYGTDLPVVELAEALAQAGPERQDAFRAK
jgi:predicted dinucleotide-binding enzyme